MIDDELEIKYFNLRNTKVHVNGSRDWINIQNKLFSIGIGWHDPHGLKFELKNTPYSYLEIDCDSTTNIPYISHYATDDYWQYKRSMNREITSGYIHNVVFGIEKVKYTEKHKNKKKHNEKILYYKRLAKQLEHNEKMKEKWNRVSEDINPYDNEYYYFDE